MSHAGHSHSGHSHAPKDFGRAFAVGVTLNTAYVVAEVVFGLRAHSVALVADAGHNLGDVFGLLMAWGATIAAKSLPTATKTYGLRKSSILSALMNAVLLLATTGAIAWEAIGRLVLPTSVDSRTVIWVALAGIIVNGGTALMFMSGRHDDLNIKGAFLHMAADAGIVLGVALSGVAMMLTGFTVIDPIVSLVISAVIVWGTWSLLRDSANLALDGVPPGVSVPEVKSFLESRPGVSQVHDLHIWAMSTTETAMTAHLVKPKGGDDAFLRQLSQDLHDRFGIEHATVQVEHGDPDHPCGLEPDEVV